MMEEGRERGMEDKEGWKRWEGWKGELKEEWKRRKGWKREEKKDG